MSKLFRALVISALATGVVAAAMHVFSSKPTAAPPAAGGGDGALVDADHLTEEEKDLLVEELMRQV